MPVVPRVSDQVTALAPLPRITPRPEVSPEAPAEAFGGPAPVDFSGVTKQLTEYAQQERDKADQVAVLDADNQLSTLSTDLQTKALQRKGKDAMGAAADTSSAWKDGVSQIEGTLSSDKQRIAFRNRVGARWGSLYETVERHTAVESDNYDNEQTDSALKSRYNDALKNPDQSGQSVLETRAILADKGKREGWSSDIVAQKQAAAVSQIHKGVISEMIDSGQDLAAKNYYKGIQDQVTGGDTPDIDRLLRAGSVRGESQRQADQILAAGGNMSDAVAKARALTDPEVRDATEERVRGDFRERAQALAQGREQTMTEAGNTLDRTHDINAIPASVWSNFTVGEKTSLLDYKKKLDDPAGVKTDWGTYYSLTSMASADATKDAFVSRNLMLDRSRLSNEQFKEVVDLQAKMRKGDQATDDKLDGIRTREQIVTSSLNGIGVGVNFSSRNSDKPIMDEVRRSVDAQVVQLEQQTKKKATTVDVQRITDEILTKRLVSTPGMIWGRNEDQKRLYEIGPEDQLILSPKDIPVADRRALESNMRQRGLPVTDDTLVQNYRAYLTSIMKHGPE